MATSDTPERATAANPPAPGPTAAELRRGLVNYLTRYHWIRSPQIEHAFAEVPRENFLPAQTPLQKVYSDEAICVKWDADETPTSSSSQPGLMADMLETLALSPGMRVLEVGAGVGYNAALLANILGNGALLTTIDLDPAMAQTAFQNLQRLAALHPQPGYERVTVVAADGSQGFASHAPFDRIIVTVQQWEISPEWVAQLKVGGWLLLPLSLSPALWGGGALIPAFEKQADGTLQAVAVCRGAFMYMRGDLAHPTLAKPVALPLKATQVYPETNGVELADARFFIWFIQPNPTILQLLQNADPAQMVLEGNLKLEFSEDDGSEEARQAIGQANWGFNILQAAAFGGKTYPLLLAQPIGGQANSAPVEQNDPFHTHLRDGWRYRPAGSGYVDENGIILSNFVALANEKAGIYLQAWRFPHATSFSGLRKMQQIWEAWNTLGRPTATDYRPLAFPVGTDAPTAGYVISRHFYNILFPA